MVRPLIMQRGAKFNKGGRGKRDALEILDSILQNVLGNEMVSRAYLIRKLGLNPVTLYNYLDRLEAAGAVEFVEGERGVYVKPLPRAFHLHTLISVARGLMESEAGKEYNRVVTSLASIMRSAGFRVEESMSPFYDLEVEGRGCRLRLAVLLPGDPLARFRVSHAWVYSSPGSILLDLGEYNVGGNVVSDVSALLSRLRSECG